MTIGSMANVPRMAVDSHSTPSHVRHSQQNVLTYAQDTDGTIDFDEHPSTISGQAGQAATKKQERQLLRLVIPAFAGIHLRRQSGLLPMQK